MHDLTLATDGGGSILGPALATQLFGINAKGLGLTGRYASHSTEGYPLSVGVGVISRSWCIAKRAVEVLLKRTLSANVHGLHVALDKDAPDLIADVLEDHGCVIERFSKVDAYRRDRGLVLIEDLFKHSQVIISAEGPVDFYEYADSLVMSTNPTGRGGKYLLRSANLADTTAIAVPGSELASGYVVLSPAGFEAGCHATAVAALLAEQCLRQPLFEDYFLKRMRTAHNGFFHEGM